MGNTTSCCTNEQTRSTVTNEALGETLRKKKKGKDIEKFLVEKKPDPARGSTVKRPASPSYAELEDKTSLENINNLYKLGPVVGHGKYGTVRLATPVNNPDKVLAVKAIALSKVAHELHLLK